MAMGGPAPRKGSIDLLDSFALPRPGGAGPGGGPGRDGLALVIAGGETLFDYRGYREAWQQRADRLGLAPVVLGPVPDPALPSLGAAAGGVGFPSTQGGFGPGGLES